MSSTALASLLLLVGLSAAGARTPDKFHITPEEQAACEIDATTFCGSAYPDEDALVSCMRSKESKLSPTCLKTFKAGLKRRHM